MGIVGDEGGLARWPPLAARFASGLAALHSRSGSDAASAVACSLQVGRVWLLFCAPLASSKQWLQRPSLSG